MGEGQLFAAELEPEAERFQPRLWFADVVDLALSGVLGWGAVRALELPRTPGALVVAGVLAWVVVSAVGGASGWTVGRWLLGPRLVRAGGGRPGWLRGLLRAAAGPVDVVVGVVLQRRMLDRLLGVHGEEAGGRERLRAAGWMAPWALVLAGTVYCLVMPTRDEALRFLVRLPGWRCCNERAASWQCDVSVAKAVREARKGHEQARAVALDCPKARKHLDP